MKPTKSIGKTIERYALFALNVPIVMGTNIYAKQLNSINKSQKMNVLFIAVDDLKPIMGCYGDKIIKTPNLDRLANKGSIFLSNYCQQAVSGPSRASLMTGKRPDYTKIWDMKVRMRDINPNIVTIPQHFIAQGYKTVAIGKIFDPRCVDASIDKPSWTVPHYGVYNVDADYYYNKQSPIISGFFNSPETRSKYNEYMKQAADKGLKGSAASDYASKQLRPSVECMEGPDNIYFDGAMVIKANKILEDLAKDVNKPFFYAVGFYRPHLPFIAPKKYWDLYDRDKLPIAEFQSHANNSPELAYHNSEELRSFTDIPPVIGLENKSENAIKLPIEKQKELIHGYYAAVSYVDAQIGKLLNKLDSLGLTQNTIIVLWGDHGWHLGDHDLWCKHTNFEQATHAPLMTKTIRSANIHTRVKWDIPFVQNAID